MTITDEKTAELRHLATTQAKGLRDLADLIEDNPDLARILEYTLRTTIVPVGNNDDPRGDLAIVARAVSHATKEYDDNWGYLNIEFGPVTFSFYAHREQVCERVVTGVREVTKEVPDPEALAKVPTVRVTETVEDVEWVCSPLLAHDTQAGAA